MRRVPAALLALTVVPASLVLPVLTPAAPHAHAVTPHLGELSLGGVDAATLAHSSLSKASLAHRPVVLTAPLAVHTFGLVGVTWDKGTGAAGTAVSVRVREHGRWTPWTALSTQDELGPDDAESRATTRTGTDPLLTSDADGVQVRVDSPDGRAPRALRAELLDPGTSKADAFMTPKLPPSTAHAESALPPIISRAEWGADESLRGRTPTYNATVKVGVLHHTASTNSYDEAGAAEQLRAVYAYHTKSLGWSDIGYNFLVDKFGRLYEGRYGGIDKPVMGAHAGGFNTDTFGISALGNYDAVAPPQVMVDAITTLFAWKLGLSHRDPLGTASLTSAGGGTSRFAKGTTITVPTIIGHRDVGATACPGRYLYPFLDAIRQGARALEGDAIYDVSTSPSRVSVDATGATPDGTVSLTARTSTAESWHLAVTAADGSVVKAFDGTTAGPEPIAATWDRRTPAGALVPPGTYTLTLSGASAVGAVRPAVSTFTVALPVVATPDPAPTPDTEPLLKNPPTLAPVYTTAGDVAYRGRAWSTTCADFGSLHRCLAKITASYTVRDRTGKIVTKVGLIPSAWAYTATIAPDWDASRYSVPGPFTVGTTPWRTSCDVPAGPRLCRVEVYQAHWERAKVKNRIAYVQKSSWVLNRYVRLTVPK